MENFTFRRLSFLLLVMAFTLSCSDEPIENFEGPEATVTANASSKAIRNIARPIKDQYIVLLSKKPAKADLRANAALEALTKEVGNMPQARVKGIYKASLTGFVAKLNKAQVEKMKNDPRVISVIEDRYVQLEEVEEATATVQEYPWYGLDRIDQRDKLMDRTYSFTSTGSGVTAYIIDTGIRSTHSEFGGRASSGFDFVEAYPDAGDTHDPNFGSGEDCHGHGTHVAGIIGGSTYGVAKDVKLVGLKTFACKDYTPWSRIILAIDWVTANAVKPAVVNMSLGEPVSEIEDLSDTAVQNSIASGITYVISGGNDFIDACDYSPARVPEAISVGASTITNEMAYFSNYGNCLDLFAPGVYILSAGNLGDDVTRYMSGTSMAAPHVVGVVALYLSAHPEATPAEVHEAVVSNATPEMITGVPSGPTSLLYSHWTPVNFTPSVQPDLQFTTYSTKLRGNDYRVEISWTAPENSNVVLYRDGNAIFEPSLNQTTFTDYLDNVKNTTIEYKVCEVLYNNCQTSNVIIGNGGSGTEPTNSPPTPEFSFSADLLNVQFTDASTDTDGSIVSWAWNFGDGNSSSAQHPQHTYLQSGTYEVSLGVTDDAGESRSTTKMITLSEEAPAPDSIELSAVGSKVKGQWQTSLSWTPAGTSATIDIYRNGIFLSTVNNTGSYVDNTSFKGGGTLEYKICETGSVECSNTVVVQF